MSQNYPFNIPSGVNIFPTTSGLQTLGISDKPFDKLYVSDVILANGAKAAEIWISGNSTATAISNTSDFFVVSGTYNNGLVNSHYFATTANPMRVTYVHPESTYAIINLNSSTHAATSNDILEMGFLLDGIIQSKSIQEVKFPNNDIRPMSTSMLVQLVSGNYIQVGLKNESGANNATVAYCNMSIIGL